MGKLLRGDEESDRQAARWPFLDGTEEIPVRRRRLACLALAEPLWCSGSVEPGGRRLAAKALRLARARSPNCSSRTRYGRR